MPVVGDGEAIVELVGIGAVIVSAQLIVKLHAVGIIELVDGAGGIRGTGSGKPLSLGIRPVFALQNDITVAANGLVVVVIEDQRLAIHGIPNTVAHLVFPARIQLVVAKCGNRLRGVVLFGVIRFISLGIGLGLSMMEGIGCTIFCGCRRHKTGRAHTLFATKTLQALGREAGFAQRGGGTPRICGYRLLAGGELPCGGLGLGCRSNERLLNRGLGVLGLRLDGANETGLAVIIMNSAGAIACYIVDFLVIASRNKRIRRVTRLLFIGRTLNIR